MRSRLKLGIEWQVAALMCAVIASIGVAGGSAADAHGATLAEAVRARYGGGWRLVWPPLPEGGPNGGTLLPGALTDTALADGRAGPIDLAAAGYCAAAGSDDGRGLRTIPMPETRFDPAADDGAATAEAARLLAGLGVGPAAVARYAFAFSDVRFHAAPTDERRKREAAARRTPACLANPRMRLAISVVLSADVVWRLATRRPLTEAALAGVTARLGAGAAPSMSRTASGLDVYEFRLARRVVAVKLDAPAARPAP